MQALAADGLAIPTGIVTAAVMARIVGADGYGVLALAVSVVGTIEWGLTALLSRASVVLVGEAEDSRRAASGILRIHWRLGVAGTAAAALVAWPAAWVFADARVGICLAILAVEVVLVTAAGGCRSILAGQGRYGARAWVGAVRWTTRLVAVVGFVVAGWSVWGAAIGNVIAAAAALVVARWAVGLVAREAQSSPTPNFWRVAWPTFWLAMSLRLLDKVGLIAVRVLGGSVEDAGFYAAAQNFAMAPGLAAMALSPLILGAVSRARAAGQERGAALLGRDVLRLVLLSWPFLAVVGVSALDIVTVIYGARFAPAAPLAAPFLVTAAALAVITVTSALLAARGEAGTAVRSTWPILPAAFVGFGVTVPEYGPWGAAVSTAIAASVGAALSLVAVRRTWGIDVPMSTCLRSGIVTIAVVLAAAVWPASGTDAFVRMVALSIAGGVALVLLGEFRGDVAARRTTHDRGGADYWDRVADDWRAPRDAWWRHHSDVVNVRLCRRWLTGSERRVLKTDLFDEASSAGLWAGLEQPGRSLYGIDRSVSVIELARHRHAGVIGVATDVRALPFSHDIFDAVVSNSTLDHFDSADDLVQSLAEIHRVLAPGGRLVLTLDNPEHPIVALRNALPFDLLNRVGLVPYFVGATFGAHDTRVALERLGFDVREVTAILHCPRVIAVPVGRVLARVMPGPSARSWFSRALLTFERAEGWRTRFRTGHFVAVLAIKKPGSGPEVADVSR